MASATPESLYRRNQSRLNLPMDSRHPSRPKAEIPIPKTISSIRFLKKMLRKFSQSTIQPISTFMASSERKFARIWRSTIMRLQLIRCKASWLSKCNLKDFRSSLWNSSGALGLTISKPCLSSGHFQTRTSVTQRSLTLHQAPRSRQKARESLSKRARTSASSSSSHRWPTSRW